MEELIEVPASSAEGPPVTGSAKAASIVSMVFFAGVVLWTGGSELLAPPRKVQLVGQEAAAAKAAKEAKKDRGFWDGSLARSFETDFRLRGNVRRKVGPYWSLAMLKIGDVIASDVIIGKDNWLFLRDRVQIKKSASDQGKVIFPHLMAAFSRSLAAHGTTLVTLPVLRKGVACEERLPDGLDPDPQLDRDIIDNLLSLGVPTVDMFDKWRSMPPAEVYKSQDTHWELQARVEAIKQLVRTVPGIPRHEVGAWHTFGDARLNGGNLNFVGISVRHPAATMASATTERYINLFPESFAAELEDGTYPSKLLLVGTSFSGGFQFRELLAALLRAGVDDGSELGRSVFSSLKDTLEKRFDHLPEFLLIEVPLFQAANTTRLAPAPNEAAGAIFGALNEDQAYDYAPEDLLVPPDSNPSLDGRKYWSYSPGALISSGDGVLLLEIEFENDVPSEWKLSMGGARIPISVPAGKTRRVLPLIEGPTVADQVTLLPEGDGADSAQFRMSVVMDVDLEGAQPVPGTMGPGGTWEFQGELSPAGFDALSIRWTEATEIPFAVTVIGVDAKGAPLEKSWAMSESARSRFGLFTVGGFAGGKITEVRLGGVAGDVQVDIASKRMPQ